MTLTKEDLQAIGQLMDNKLMSALESVNARLDSMQYDISNMQGDISNMQDSVSGLKEGQAKMEAQMSTMEESLQIVRSSQINVELIELPKIGAAMDGYKAAHDKNQAQDKRIAALEDMMDRHDTRIGVLELMRTKQR